MSEQLQGVLAGGGIAVVVALLGFIAEGRRDRRRITHELAQAAEQRQHDWDQKHYEDLRDAYSAFYAEMRELEVLGRKYVVDRGYNYVTDPESPLDPSDGYEKEAEDLLARLRPFADQPLQAAARSYLDSYYAAFWASRQDRDPAVPAMGEAEDRFLAEGRRALRTTA